jgi:UDP-N-acetylmuramoyl-tripeptide--D-alanyl-D-alanine ligase
MEIVSLYQKLKVSTGICTDNRKIKKGQIFVALKGDNFNGNNFAIQAIADGAAYAIVDEKVGNDERCILVENTLDTLQALAKYHRQQFSIPVIALTGSNGKTTTKELVAAVLEKKYKVHYTKGNLNNHIGIPLTLLEMPMDTEIAVIEMGANHQREIEGYCKYVLPNYGLITNIGKAHLEGFGGIEGVLKGKTELYQYIGVHGGKLFVSDMSQRLLDKSSEFVDKNNIIFYGKGATALASGGLLETKECLSFRWKGNEIKTQLVGDYNIENALLAVCIGLYFDVAEKDICEALERYSPNNNRSQMIEYKGNKIVMDAYNANPSSLSVALQNFDKLASPAKIAIVGEMMELGEYSRVEHQKIAQQVSQMELEARIFVGEGFSFLKADNSVLYFENTQALKSWFDAQGYSTKTILLKGSRKNALENLLKG